MEISYVDSDNGKRLLVVNQYTFSKQKVLKSGEVFWRCTKKSLNCPAKVFTLGAENLVSRSQLEHSHEANESKLNRKIISSACKRKAVDDISEKPAKIIRQVLVSELPETIATTDIAYIRRNMYNARRKFLPGPLPKDKTEVHNMVGAANVQTSKNECFVFINCPVSNIIVFSCETNIRLLCETLKVYMDGTFSYSTKYFLQLFTIHGLINGHYIPLVFCLLPDKRSETYATLFEKLTTEILGRYGTILRPSEVFVDFEKSIHTALEAIWPSSKIYGCRFHLHQSWFRKIQTLGLTVEFRNKNSEVGRWLRYTFGLTYLNPDEVGDCFALDLFAEKPIHAQVDKYADYLLETYIEEDAPFPPSMWATATPSITNTTNACESFHSKLNESFYSTHPSIYIFIEKLREFQIDTYVKIQSIHTPAAVKDRRTKQKLSDLSKLCEKLNNKTMSRLQFVKCASFYSSVC